MPQDPYSWAEPINLDPRKAGQAAFQSSSASMEAAKTMGVYDPDWEKPTAADIGLSGIEDEPKTLTWSDAFSGSFMENLAEMTPIIAGGKELYEVKGLWEAAERIKSDVDNDTQDATPEDYAMIREYMEEAAANKTWGYKFASILKGLIPFAGEMFIGMGAARKAASMTGFKLLSEGLEETVERAGKRNLARTFNKQALALEKAGVDLIEAKGLRDAAGKLLKTHGSPLSVAVEVVPQHMQGHLEMRGWRLTLMRLVALRWSLMAPLTPSGITSGGVLQRRVLSSSPRGWVERLSLCRVSTAFRGFKHLSLLGSPGSISSPLAKPLRR